MGYHVGASQEVSLVIQAHIPKAATPIGSKKG